MFEKLKESWKKEVRIRRERRKNREKEQRQEQQQTLEKKRKEHPLWHKTVVAKVPIIYSGLFTKATTHEVVRRCIVEQELKDTVEVSFLANPNAMSADCILLKWIPKSDIMEVVEE